MLQSERPLIILFIAAGVLCTTMIPELPNTDYRDDAVRIVFTVVGFISLVIGISSEYYGDGEYIAHHFDANRVNSYGRASVVFFILGAFLLIAEYLVIKNHVLLFVANGEALKALEIFFRIIASTLAVVLFIKMWACATYRQFIRDDKQ